MEIVLPVLASLARRDGDQDKRSAGKRRADAFTDVFGLALRHGSLPEAGGSRPLVSYLLPAWWAAELGTHIRRVASHPLGTLHRFTLDLDRHPGNDCATAPWTGPTTRTQIQTLLCDARIQRVLLGDERQIVSLTSATDQITAAQRRAVAARDRCRTAKGCNRPPAFCDVHHLQARADGGPTEIANLVLVSC